MGIAGNLTADQLASYNNNGFLVLDSFSTPDEVQEMRHRMDELLQGFDGNSSSIFSTKNQKQHTDNYFYDSVENISFFFEEKAFGEDGCLKQSKELSINKVGHALHELDPVFKKVSNSEKISSIFSSLGYKRPAVIQSMYIFKDCMILQEVIFQELLLSNTWLEFRNLLCHGHDEQPGIGGEVVPHQDNSFLYTEPPSCTGLWLALEDATVTNGCLWAIPGSHKNGLVRRFIRDEDGVHFDRPSPSYDQNDFVPLEMKAGSLVVIHGDLIHQSLENQSPNSRHALSLHVVDTDGCTWAKENWIRRKTDPAPLYVS